jgi:putative ABC transport system permease protein
MGETTSTKVRVERLGILDEAVASLLERRTRSLLTCLGTVLGVGVLVAVLGLTASASAQIDDRFTDLAATEVTITQLPDTVGVRSLAFPRDFEQRVLRLDGSKRAGMAWNIPPEQAPVSGSGVPGQGDTSGQVPVMAVSPAALGVAGAHVRTGRLYDDFADANGVRAAVLGPTAAASLGVVDVSTRPSISIGGVWFVVVGVLDDVARHPELLNSVLLPTNTARQVWGDPEASDAFGWVEVRPGAGGVVADQLAAAVSPVHPEMFEVIPPPDPQVLRGTISNDLESLFLVLAGICLLVGMVGIANTTSVTVMERLGEIGLRRALGARRIHIAWQFLVEAGVVGLVGGLMGALIGVCVVIGVSVGSGWTAVIPPALVPLGPAIGATTALIAAIYPAMRAASTEPVVALRSGT